MDNYIADCIIYTRVSTEGQKDGFSPQEQIDMGINLCKSKGWTYQVEDGDLGRSGSSDKLEARPILKKIVDKWAIEKRFKYLFVAEIDRLSRNPALLFYVKKIFLDSGIKIATPNGIYDLESDKDDFFTDLLGLMAKLDNRTRIANFIRGKNGAKKLGFYIGGPVPPGFDTIKVQVGDKNRSRFVISKTTPNVYLRIVELFLELGMSSDKVALTLNNEKVPTTGRFMFDNPQRDKLKQGYGFYWVGNTILSILKNPFYKGKIVDGVQIIPSLISEERWNRIQETIIKNKRGNAKSAKHPALLRGLLAGECCSLAISPLVRNTISSKPGILNYRKYVCDGRNKDMVERQYKPACDLPIIDMNWLDEIVWLRVKGTLLYDDDLKNVILKIKNQSDLPALEQKIHELKAGIKRFRQAKSDMLDFLASGYWTKDEVMAKVLRVDEDITKANNEIKLFQDQIAGGQELTRFLNGLKEVRYEMNKEFREYTFEQKRDLLLKIINKIYISYSEANVECERDCWNIRIDFKMRLSDIPVLQGFPNRYRRYCLI